MKFMCRRCDSRRCLFESVIIDHFDTVSSVIEPVRCPLSGTIPEWEAVPKCG